MVVALLASIWLAASEVGSRPDAAQAVTVAVPVERIADDYGRDLAWLVGSHSADLYSTALALHRCQACSEGNPLGPSAEARIALKGAGVATTGLTLWKLRRAGKHRAATILRWTAVAVNAAFVTNNSIKAVRQR